MFSIFKYLPLLVLTFSFNKSYCNLAEFQANIDGFMNTFDEAYPTDSPTSTDEITVENEFLSESSALEERPKDYEETGGVQEELVVTETVFQPGSEIRHEVNEDLMKMATRLVSSISPDLELVNITEAVSMVTDKVERSFSLRVAQRDCEADCSIACRVDVVSHGEEDTVTWHNCLETNEVPRAKRGAVGGFKQVDQAEAQELAEIAAQTLDSIDADDVRRVVTQVIRAQKQLVNGILYHLTLEMAQSDCKEDEEKCEGKLTDYNICKILMQRLFSGDAPRNAQVIKSECNPISKAKEFDNKKEEKRTRRHIVAMDGTESNMVVNRNHAMSKKSFSHDRVMGGKTRQDPNSVKIKEMSDFALAEIDSSSNSLNKQKIHRVVEAYSQVVAGVKYLLTLELVETNCRKGSAQETSTCSPLNDRVLQLCDIVVWDKPWENFRKVTKVNCSPANSREKRALLGGKKPADVNNERVREMAQFAVAQLDAQSNSLNSQKLVEIKEAQTQVVAGSNYYLKLQLVETNCRKGSETNEACSSSSNKPVQECDVVVYDRPWDKHREMTSANCKTLTASRRRRALLGGKTPADVNDERVREMAQFAVAQLDAQSNSLNSQKLVEIKEAQTQVVAGSNYYLKLQLVETNCRKGSETNEACSSSSNKPVQECDVVVYDRPWDKHREMTSANCKTLTATRRRREQPIGGNHPIENDSDDIMEMAQYAVEDLNKKSNSIVKKTLVELISAETQVVNGINYHLKLRVVDSNCKKNDANAKNCIPKDNSTPQECDVTVWSQLWKNRRSVTKFNCKDSPDNKVQSAGGLRQIDPLAPEVLKAARLSLKTIDKSSNSVYKHALVRVIDSKVQTVAGKKYYLTIEVGESECTKTSQEENCSVKPDNSMMDRCNVVVWDRPWLELQEVISAHCGKLMKRSVDAQYDINALHVSMFEEFKRIYNKNYSSEEEHHKRLRIFRANLKKIQTLQDTEQGTAVYGPNMFADLSENEFKRQYLGLKTGPAPRPSRHHMTPAEIPDVTLPVDFDWRDRGAVTPVKNQGQCGSCWAFSVTGNVEGQWFLRHGKLLSLSEQELVDCDKRDDGCMGGYMTQAYEAIEELGGLETEDEYPYEAENESCKFNKTEARATVTSSVNITTNETQIAQWLYKNGPISIGINANAMQFYMGGVSHPLKFLCSKDQLDHGVLLVGFGVHRSTIRHKILPYWLVKNSWGPHWGEKGYYRVYRGDGTCGVNQMASSAIVG
ncbi:uncharacterized protein LOC128988613 isoform X1 [Macrosteles quadrilineatus]|uniref:uncharacterized protein LOC128988613 isoform X1 n=1 Tax=Macrosteles quadrilineatus TaxID=74068 RepID=UPI0023E134FE|nr:uncharacterized protein LOC128988613 isoform X1 [Macrosteles quadrilineatus]